MSRKLILTHKESSAWQRQPERHGVARLGLLHEFEVATLSHHDLTGEGESDACASVLGREERDEDAVAVGGGDGGAIVGEEKTHPRPLP